MYQSIELQGGVDFYLEDVILSVSWTRRVLHDLY